MPEIPVAVNVEFTSDWHIGVGAGRHGSVDRTIATDAEGLPYVPAKSAIGILRDSAEIAANALDGGAPGVWARWVTTLFGSQPALADRPDAAPIASALTARPLRMREAERAYFATAPIGSTTTTVTRSDLIAATKVIRTGVMIDPESGTAVHDAFRVEERARAGIGVSGEWTLTYPHGVDPWPAKFLLLAAAGIARGIGGKRRRGGGAALITLAGIGEVTDYVDELDAPPEPWSTSPPVVADPTPSVPQTTELRHAYDLVIEVQLPVVVDTGLWGNVVRTSRVVPGAMLLPMVGRALDGRLSDLVRQGGIVVTDATPTVDGTRGLPWPRAFTQSKDASPGDDEYVNVAASHNANPRLKPKTGAFVDPLCSRWRGVEITQGIHAVIDDAAQRPTSESGGLFVYEGIAPGTVLRAEVYLPAGIELDAAAVEGPRRMGRSSKDDYGLVEVRLEPALPARDVSAIPAGTQFAVWLTSDVLLRNERGGSDTTPAGLATALSSMLEVDVSVATPSADGTGAFRETLLVNVSRRQTWQRAWGLPRPSLVGFGAGSVVICNAGQEISANRIAALHTAGIGERTAEGFGRVLLGVGALASSTLTIATSPPGPDNPAYRASPQANPHILSAAWRTLISRRAAVRAAELQTVYLRSGLTRAQLGNLRSIVSRLGLDGGRDSARIWIARTRGGRKVGAWGQGELTAIGNLILADPDTADHPVWNALELTSPLEISPDERRALTVHAVQMTMTETIRHAGRNAVN